MKKTISYSLNEMQKDTLERIKELSKTAHFIDLKFRDNGKDKFEQADFLRGILKQL